jgi:hypothetical protein
MQRISAKDVHLPEKCASLTWAMRAIMPWSYRHHDVAC